MSTRGLLRSKLVWLLIVIVAFVIVYQLSNSFVYNQQHALYCKKLSWGMNIGQVNDLLGNMGTMNWSEFVDEGTDIKKVQFSFTNPLLNFRYGGVTFLYFNKNSYYSATRYAPVGEEKKLCNIWERNH